MKLTKRLGAVLMLAMLVLAMSMSASAAKAKINKKSQTIGVGESFTLKVKNAKKVKWSSSDASVAKVSKKGKVTGVKGGNATITGKVDKKSYKCAVTVEQVAFKSDAPTAVVVKGAVDLSTFVEVAPAGLKLKWTSSDATKATVENGKVTGVAQGTATITATSEDGKASASLNVTVNPAAEETKGNTNVVVINDDNFDELFDQYFGRVVVSTYYLDAKGNLLNPMNYIHGTVRTKAETAVTKAYKDDPDAQGIYASEIKEFGDGDVQMMQQQYAYYVKKAEISDLRSYGGAMIQYHINNYEVDFSGSRPIFKKLISTVPLGAVSYGMNESDNTYQSGNFGYVRVNRGEKVSLARMYFPKAGTSDIYYDYRTQHHNKRQSAKGTKVVEYSVPGIDGKAMLGFDVATIGFNWKQSWVDAYLQSSTQTEVWDVDEAEDLLKKVTMFQLEDDRFMFVDFHLYK